MRERLANIVERLRDLQDGGVSGPFATLSAADAEFLARGFEAFLSGVELDKAFGARRSRGAPQTIPETEQAAVALDVIMRRECKDPPDTWAALEQDHGLSERSLRTITETYRNSAMCQWLTKRLSGGK